MPDAFDFDFSRVDPARAREILSGFGGKPTRLMEVCGTHTHQIARFGIKSLLPNGAQLQSGPGCPVCVTSAPALSCAIELCKKRNVTLAVYGDMLRVPARLPADTLLNARAAGADVRVVFSAADAVDLAAREPSREVVFFAVGFETTAAGTAAALLDAARLELPNFSMLSVLKRVEPALRLLLQSADLRCDGLLLPGHVASIVGTDGFRFLEELGIPGVICGFEAGDILLSLTMLLTMLRNGEVGVQNEYTRAVKSHGNTAALCLIDRAFCPCADVWRGLGVVDGGGFALRDEFSRFDAWRRFGLDRLCPEPPAACRCADVICARIAPRDCPMFGTTCTPSSPLGPCMVASEGSCAAAYRYRAAEICV